MENRNGFKSHPLDMNDFDDDQIFYSNSSSSNTYYSNNNNNNNRTTTTAYYNSNSNNNNQYNKYPVNNNTNINYNNNSNTSNFVPQTISNDSKPKVPKRRLPQIPDKLNATSNFLKQQLFQQQKQINFYIEIENVKWFYKLDLIENSSNMAPNVSITEDTNDKWIYFNRLDSSSLEAECRGFLSRKQYDSNSQPNLVQVLDGLYEVNLLTKKCQAIYWKGKLK